MSTDSAGPVTPKGPVRQVRILDIPLTRVRRPVDLVLMLLSLLGIAAVLALAVYAYATTTGVTEDVQSALAQVVRTILLVPVNVIEGLLILVLPIIVVIEQLVRRNVRAVLDAIAAAAVAYVVALLAIWLLDAFATNALARSLLRFQDGAWVITISAPVAALGAFLTAVGTSDRRRIVRISWNLLWFVLIVTVITGTTTLVAAIVSVLIGRATGLGMRYLSGVLSQRAHGLELVEGIRRAGVDPIRVIRIGDSTLAEDLRQDVVEAAGPIGYTAPAFATPSRTGSVPPTAAQPEATAAAEPTAATDARGAATHPLDGRVEALGGPVEAPGNPTDVLAGPSDTETSLLAQLPESATVANEREGANRVYAVIDSDGVRWDAVVLDGDRQVIGMLSAVISTIVRRGLARRTAVSLRQAAERAALMYYAASAAGVNSPRLRGIAETEDSVLLLGEHIDHARQLSDLPNSAITDEVMINAWKQLQIAHEAGLAHRNLTADTLMIADADGPDAGEVWLNGWEEGEIASGSLARRVDRTQLLTLLALRVGPERAIAAAARVLSIEQLAEIAPLLQPIALPMQTRAEARADKAGMAALRAHLVDFIPTAGVVEPIRLSRFSARTVITLTIAVVAGWALLTTLNFQEIAEVISEANPFWMVVAFALGLVTYVGSAMGLVGFSPEKLGLWRTTLVQVAASVVTLVAPAGVGPAALNLRYMQKRGLETPVALATVALLQVSQFVTTVLLLIAIALLTGSSGALQGFPSGAALIVAAALAVVVGVAFAVPALRRWVIAKVTPTLKQVWPRLVWVVGQPQRLAIALGGNLVQTLGYLASFAAALAAFGQTLPATTLAIIYLTGTAVGSAVPTPGGIGTVEFALSTGLRTAGIATATAASTAVLFRVLTFWIRVPLGWAALRYLQKQNAL
ncbi:lysylphosphatidylglycerol synthase transmembrane domain-containing protein [Occultella kanbiaonis]|uniref:lysylphosphatidylglycerol synthase transmembrane domain-containing protein n=1 Tax=Occultella kanbiaonis TaxID=2675754 RepID=UPI0013D1BAB2|nr:lysylphosphatidylglycerol synthase transmembrane domain-containing protein [Occultella kanbiaonis]